MLGLVGGVGLDHGAQCLAGTPRTRRFERRRIDEGLRRLPCRRAAPELCAQRLESVREPLELQGEDVVDLVLGEPPTLGLVVGADRGQRVARFAGDSSLLREGAERVADRVMDPRAAQVHGHPGQVDRVEPTPESVTGFEHDARDTCPRQCGCHRQAGDAGADHDHAVHRSVDVGRDFAGPPVVPLIAHGATSRHHHGRAADARPTVSVCPGTSTSWSWAGGSAAA